MKPYTRRCNSNFSYLRLCEHATNKFVLYSPYKPLFCALCEILGTKLNLFSER